MARSALHRRTLVASFIGPFLALSGGAWADVSAPARLPLAVGATLNACNNLTTRVAAPDLVLESADIVTAGAVVFAGQPLPEHCRVAGKFGERVSPVDGKTYAIHFEMRLPTHWNGRFFYQANGGLDGVVLPAYGGVNGGNALTNALALGYAVLSSDGGHSAAQNPTFGLDPQARVDYGYGAVAALTPIAKSLIGVAYGKKPDRSYFGGCSNGGRLTMVAAARFADQYDGFLVGDPGFRLPKAAVANLAGSQAYAKLASNPADLSTGFTLTERRLVADAVLARCDALDGVADGMIQDLAACQTKFSLERDVPTCTGERDGHCLSTEQKTAISSLFAGAKTADGQKLYTSFPYDAGVAAGGWTFWKFVAPLKLDSAAIAFVWQVPPADPKSFDGAAFALGQKPEQLLARIQATDETYATSALDFMLPPHASDMTAVQVRGAKIMVYHGSSDPIFSVDDTTAWYEALNAAQGGHAGDFARYYRVPGMNHCSGGPSTDQFDMLTPLVAWVEQGQVPGAVLARARGVGNPAAVNPDLPASWSPARTRPLCPYPTVARYRGQGSVEDSTNFSCE